MSKLILLTRALWSVSTSPSMPAWPTYRRHVERERALISHHSRDPAALQARLLAMTASQPRALAWTLPWAPAAPLSLARLVAALVAFGDDYSGALPLEYLPGAPARDLIDRLGEAAKKQGRQLDVCEQLAAALVQTQGRVWAAVLLLHCATRALARGRDRRVDPALALWLDERIALGRPVAPFEEAISQGGDPLGDAYHYWAMVAAGMAAARAQRTGRAGAGRALQGLFYQAPDLMQAIRQNLFQNKLFYGNHATVDRLGLRHGLAIGAALCGAAARETAARDHRGALVPAPARLPAPSPVR